MGNSWYWPLVRYAIVAVFVATALWPASALADEPAGIAVGVLSPWTGALAPAGQRLKNGVDLAVSEINASGGLLGLDLAVRLEDNRSSPETAAQAARQLADAGTGVIIAGGPAGAALQAAEVAAEENVPLIATLPLDAAQRDTGWIFSAAFAEELQARAQARYMAGTLGCARPLQIVDAADEESVARATLTADALQEAGVPFVAGTDSQPDEREFEAQLGEARAADADCLMWVGPLSAASAVRTQMVALGLGEVPLVVDFGGAATIAAGARSEIDPVAAGMLTAAQFSPEDTRPAAQEFREHYRTVYGTLPSTEAALAYDAVMLYRTAVQRAGSTDPHAVREALASLDGVAGLATTPSFSMGADGTAIKGVTILQSGEDGAWHFKGMVDAGTAPAVSPVESGDLSGRLTFAGSTSVQPLAAKLADAFRTLHPNLVLDIAAGGSVVGIQAIHDGTVDIGMASRDLSAEEEQDIEVFKIAVDVIAVAVSEANPVASLTLQQLRDIYTGKIVNWRDVGGADEPISVVVREKTSGTRGAFDAIVLGEGIEPTATGLRTAMTAGDAAALVQADPFAIGYVGFGNIEPHLHLLAIDGVVPSVETVRDGTYPLVRPLQLMTGALSQPAALSFIDFVLGPQGQAIVAENGWVPVR